MLLVVCFVDIIVSVILRVCVKEQKVFGKNKKRPRSAVANRGAGVKKKTKLSEQGVKTKARTSMRNKALV